MIPAV